MKYVYIRDSSKYIYQTGAGVMGTNAIFFMSLAIAMYKNC